MNWYRKIKIANNVQISINTQAYENSLKERVYELDAFNIRQKQRLSNFALDLNNIVSVLNKYQYPRLREMQQAIQSRDNRALEQILFDLSTFNRNVHKAAGWRNSEQYKDLDNAVHHYRDFVDHAEMTAPGYQEYSSQQMLRDLEPMIVATRQNMEKIAEIIKQAVSRLPSWGGAPIVIEAGTISKDDNYFQDPQDSATIEFAPSGDDFNPSFSLFIIDNKIIIDDVLEAGDTDFFIDSRLQNDYFNLIKEIRNPGSTQRSGKILTLYTARPVKDRNLYMGATQIPSNIFLTNNYNSAIGLGIDLAGQDTRRDIWKVRIEDKYLVQTLDGPEKQYQVVGDTTVPVRSMTLLDIGE